MARRVRIGAAATLAALALTLTGGPREVGAGVAPARADTPFAGKGMWIWYVSRSNGGDLGKIARRARRHGIRTIYVKAADGRYSWAQFTPGLVSYMHSRGVQVCAWQFVYGAYPAVEAQRGAEAVADGADCLVIDAESHYEGRYAAADSYVDHLRSAIGGSFPVALTSFPYVDYHPGLPYSVFMGRNGARFNLPQIYWHTIGDSVATAFAHTWRFNRVYRRPIMPIGQTYDDPPLRQIRLFRRYAHEYLFRGVSWWVWQLTDRREWRALSRPLGGVPGFERPNGAFPHLRRGDSGDLVVWLQEYLRGAGRHVPVTGWFGPKTKRAVTRFERLEGLPADGVVGRVTWRHLFHYRPISVDWSSRSKAAKAGAGEPRSADEPALRYEIPPGAGR